MKEKPAGRGRKSSDPLPHTMQDGSPWPKISIITPSFNQAQFLEETIRSVLLQNYPNLEYIIIDGGSTDGSVGIIKKYKPWLTYWVSEKDRGQSHAINKGIRKAQGEILFWLNSDDICLPDAYKNIAKAFTINPSASIVVGQAYFMDDHGQLSKPLNSNFTTLEDFATSPRNHIRQVSSFFRRILFEDLGMINKNLHIAMDTDILVRFTKKHSPLVINKFVSAFRIHDAG